jgi:glycosyltransferase involved in cell wall biosynthesis
MHANQVTHEALRIVVDDESSDAASSVAVQMGARVIRQETCCGPAVARNRGAVKAHAEQLVFVDTDVLVQKDTLWALAIRLQSGCDAVFGSYVAYNVDNLPTSLAAAEHAGLRLIDHAPRRGAHGGEIAFLHPLSTGGLLTELCRPASEMATLA